MAMKRIGRILSGGVVVLCVILLFTPNTHSQGFKAVRQKFVISGSVGLSGVTMQGLVGPSGPPVTDENGVYSAEVEYGWSGTVTPVKLGYTFEPKTRAYTNVAESKTEESYQANRVTFTITGSTGQPGVQLNGYPEETISDLNGRYTATIPFAWSGTIVPEKVGYRFDPPSKTYNQVKENKSGENFGASKLTFKVAGSVGVGGVTMKGLPNNPVTAADGSYSDDVPYGWTGTATPTKDGYTFTPEKRDYTQVMESATAENYAAQVFTYQITGSAGMAGVILEGLPENPMTDENGLYTAIVSYGWNGKVTPSRPGYKFTPSSRDYPPVVSDAAAQDYTPTMIQLTISGNVATKGVTMNGLPNNPVSDATGFYTAKVDYAWSGTVTPTKEGWLFEDPAKVYGSVTSDLTNQNYKAKPITYKIAGNVGQAQVRLEGLPGTVVSGPDGSYSADVTFKWNGNVTPKKVGYTFTPATRTYGEVLTDQLYEDYQAGVLQYTVAGRVIDEKGGVADVLVLAEGITISPTTDATGNYELTVDYGWRGKLTPKKDGYTFNPSTKSIDAPVIQNISNVGFSAALKMMTITDSIVIDDAPFQGVLVTAEPGGHTATTNAQGKFAIKVPYGWSGKLVPTKPGFIIEPADETSYVYTNVTQDIDKTVKTAPTPPTRPAAGPSRPATGAGQPTPGLVRPVEPNAVTEPGPEIVTADPEKQALIDMLRRQEELLRKLAGESGRPTVVGPNVPPTGRGTPSPMPITGPAVNGLFQGDLLDVLTKISEQVNVKIGVDRTVRRDTQSVNVQLVGAPIETALQRILEGGQYEFKKEGDAYLVFRPITQTFFGDQLTQVLQDISVATGVTIVAGEDVIGSTWADVSHQPLAAALDIVLAGTPYVAKETENYYLVGSRDVTEPEGTGIRYSSAFPAITETRAVYLNYITPTRAKQLMSGAYDRYVMADTDPNSHLVSVTAPRALAERIVADLKQLDQRPRHVLLDARVVVMERSGLLDMGVEWGFPQIGAGFFGDSFVGGAANVTGEIASNSDWPWGVQIGYSPDRTFTNQLLLMLNLLEQNGQAEIVSNPQVLAQDGRESQIRVVDEEHYVLTGPQSLNYYVQSEFVTITAGTTLTITPRIGDNNDITMELAVEVSESTPRGQETDLPVVTRRMARNVATVADGGTVALAGLTESRSKVLEKRVPGLSRLPFVGRLFRNTESNEATKEVAVFVTAHLVPDSYRAPTSPAVVNLRARPNEPTGADFREELVRSLSRLR